MQRKHSIMPLNPSSRRMPRGVEMANMRYFLLIAVGLSSETSHSASNIINNGRVMLYRSEFDDYTAKVSHYHYFHAGGGDHTIPVFSA